MNKNKIYCSESKNDMDNKTTDNKTDCKEEKNVSSNNNNKYIHDIRNSKTFTRETLININNLPYDKRLEILTAYNEMITHYSSIFENY